MTFPDLLKNEAHCFGVRFSSFSVNWVLKNEATRSQCLLGAGCLIFKQPRAFCLLWLSCLVLGRPSGLRLLGVALRDGSRPEGAFGRLQGRVRLI